MISYHYHLNYIFNLIELLKANLGYPTTLATTLKLMNSSVVPSVVGHHKFWFSFEAFIEGQNMTHNFWFLGSLFPSKLLRNL